MELGHPVCHTTGPSGQGRARSGAEGRWPMTQWSLSLGRQAEWSGSWGVIPRSAAAASLGALVEMLDFTSSPALLTWNLWRGPSQQNY